jgi:uncharacterized protein (TIGR03435 family)
MQINETRIKETRSQELLALGVFGRGSRLRERIEILLERGREFSPRVSRMRVAASVLALAGCVIAGSLAPRLIAFAQAGPQFEVTSIRPASEGMFRVPGGPYLFSISGNRVIEKSVSLADLIADAYDVKPYQISGQLTVGEYDIAATTGGAGAASPAQVRLMLQALLADRFRLKLHRETKALPVYELTIGKNGAKIVEVPADQRPNISMRLFTALSISRFLDDRPLVDKTGLTGEHYQIKWDETELVEELPQGKPVPSIFRAVQDQLGLKLEAVKLPVEVLVIDHAEKPDPN